MSQWTHVNGSIRIDSIRIHPYEFKNSSVHGKCMPQTSSDISNIVEPLPEGSEGPLKYYVVSNSDYSHLAAFVVVVYGDLRDYNSYFEIRDWFERVCSSFTMIRSAIMEVDVETGSAVVFQWTNTGSVMMSSDG